MNEKELLKSLGYDEDQTFDDIVFDDEKTNEFVQKHNELVERVKKEVLEKFEPLSDEKKIEFEKKGLKYEDLEVFAKDVGANKISDGLIAKFESIQKAQTDLQSKETDYNSINSRLKALEKEVKAKSITADAQKKEGAGEVESGNPPNNEPQSLGERLIPYAKALRG